MLILLSPAKKIAKHPYPKGVESSIPVMLEDADYLMGKLGKMSVGGIQKLMSISKDIANLNYSRYQNWSLPLSEKNAWMAAYSFDGQVYWGMDAKSMTKSDMKWASNNLLILSGLYGVLKPTDLMYPYRLEMGSKMKVTKVKNNLYKYWDTRITEKIKESCEENKHESIINLASNEYFKVVKKDLLDREIITPVFKDYSNGEYKSLMTYAKHARGLMARYIIKNKIKNSEKIKGFDYEGYTYNERLTEGNQWVFTRDKVPSKK